MTETDMCDVCASETHDEIMALHDDDGASLMYFCRDCLNHVLDQRGCVFCDGAASGKYTLAFDGEHAEPRRPVCRDCQQKTHGRGLLEVIEEVQKND